MRRGKHDHRRANRKYRWRTPKTDRGNKQPTAPPVASGTAAVPGASSANTVVTQIAGAETVGQMDPVVAQQIDETLATLTLKRRRFLRHFLETGNASRSVLAAGYNCSSVQSAAEMARDIMSTPAVQHAYQAVLDARGLSARGLDQIAAIHLSRHSSADGGDRDRSVRMYGMINQYIVPKTPVTAPGGRGDEILAMMTPDELTNFAERRVWPERLRHLVAPSTVAGMDVRHHHGRDEPQHPPDDVNSHARHREPRASMEPLDTVDTAPPRSAPPSAGASSSHGDYIGARAPVLGDDRVYDPQVAASPTPTAAINAPLLESYATAQREIALGEARLREAREPVVPPALRDVALRDRRW